MTNEQFRNKFKPYDIPLHGVRLPSFEITKEQKAKVGLAPESTNFEFLKALCLEGFKNLKFQKDSPEYKQYADRVKLELETFNDLGFVDYVLLVWIVIDFCKVKDIKTSRGRGSAVGSLIFYLIGITRTNPIPHKLYFERFISKTRAKKTIVDGVTYLDGSLLCDCDLDFDILRRKEVVDFLEFKFPGKTCKIANYNTLQGKLLIKEVGKIAGGKSEQEMSEINSKIEVRFGKVQDIEDAYKENAEFRKWCDENKEVYQIALKLRGLVKNKSVHASGTLISYYPIEDFIPTEMTAKKEVVCSFDMKTAAMLNVKLDLLGLRNVTVLKKAYELIGIEQDSIDVNDPFIYQNLYDLKTPHGIFQLEADCVFQACKKIKPKNLDELIALISIARPGSLKFIDEYANYTNTGTKSQLTGYAKFDNILSETGNVVLWQETLMRIAKDVFELSLEQAELIRRAAAKKKKEEMEKFKEIILGQGKKLKIEKVAEFYWELLLSSADYSFNKSHAAAYAEMAAENIYLKFKHPLQFFLALLQMTREEQNPIEEIAKIQKELPHFNIQLLPPHLVKSKLDFSIEDGNIRFGLLSIKGVSDKSIEKLEKFRGAYSNKFDIFQAAEQAGLGIGILSSLIQAGTLDEGNNVTRTCLVRECQLWNLLTDKEKKWAVQFASQFNYDLVAVVNHLKTYKDEKGKTIIKTVPNVAGKCRLFTIRKKLLPYKQIYDINSKCEAFANYYYEKSLLGFSYSQNLRQLFLSKSPDLQSIKVVNSKAPKSKVKFIGTISEFKKGTSAKGTEYLKMDVADEAETVRVMIFETEKGPKISECKSLNGALPEDENIVIVKGQFMGDVVFADLIAIQDNKIYTKLSQLKADKVIEESDDI